MTCTSTKVVRADVQSSLLDGSRSWLSMRRISFFFWAGSFGHFFKVVGLNTVDVLVLLSPTSLYVANGFAVPANATALERGAIYTHDHAGPSTKVGARQPSSWFFNGGRDTFGRAHAPPRIKTTEIQACFAGRFRGGCMTHQKVW
jgi:hypothetical protein